METFNFPSCLVCSSTNFSKKFEFKYTSNEVLNKTGINIVPETFVMNCHNCGHYFVHPQLNENLLAKYYSILNSEFYNLNIQPGIDHFLEENKEIKTIVERRTKNGKILEIGCGFGNLINLFDDNSWEKYAVEPSPLASTFVKNNFNIKIQATTFDKSKFPNNFFDVVLLFDVMEHLQKPQEFFEKIKSIIKPGGIIYIGTGNIRSVNARMAKNGWSYFGSWEHLSFVTYKSVKTLLNSNDLHLIKVINRSHKKGFINYITFLKNIIKYIIRFFFGKQYTFPLTFDHQIIIAQRM